MNSDLNPQEFGDRDDLQEIVLGSLRQILFFDDRDRENRPHKTRKGIEFRDAKLRKDIENIPKYSLISGYIRNDTVFITYMWKYVGPDPNESEGEESEESGEDDFEDLFDYINLEDNPLAFRVALQEPILYLSKNRLR